MTFKKDRKCKECGRLCWGFVCRHCFTKESFIRNHTKLHKYCGGTARPTALKLGNYRCLKCNSVLQIKDLKVFFKPRKSPKGRKISSIVLKM